MRPLILIALILPLAAIASPPEVKAQLPELSAQPDVDGRKVWHSRRFRIDSDIAISENELKLLATIADTTALALSQFTLPLYAPPEEQRPQISIHGDESSYLRAGASKGSAGMYVWKSQRVLLHAEHLFATQTNSRLHPIFDQDLVVHEIVHLCMHRVQGKLPQWLAEGLCEYFSCAHRSSGSFRFDGIEREIREHLRHRFNPLDPAIPLVPLTDILPLKPKSWLTYLASLPPSQRYRAYATSLLLTHYFLHGGNERRSQIQTALENNGQKLPPKFLVQLAKPKEIEAALTRYWSENGLNLEFCQPIPIQATELNPAETP